MRSDLKPCLTGPSVQYSLYNLRQKSTQNLGNSFQQQTAQSFRAKSLIESWELAVQNSCNLIPSKPPSVFKFQAGKSAQPIRAKIEEFNGPKFSTKHLIGQYQAKISRRSPKIVIVRYNNICADSSSITKEDKYI